MIDLLVVPNYRLKFFEVRKGRAHLLIETDDGEIDIRTRDLKSARILAAALTCNVAPISIVGDLPEG